MKQQASTVEEYINAYPREIRNKLLEIRGLILKIVPEAREVISYGIPTYKLEKNLVHFGASKNHIGLYPTPAGINKFRDELTGYSVSKGSVRFPLDKPLPIDLIRRIVSYMVKFAHNGS